MSKKHQGSKQGHRRGQHHRLPPIVIAAARRPPALLPSTPLGDAVVGWCLALVLGLLLTTFLWRVNQHVSFRDDLGQVVSFGQLALLGSGLGTLFVFLRLTSAVIPALWGQICRLYLLGAFPRVSVISTLPVERPTTRLPGTSTRRLDPTDLLNIPGAVSRETKTYHLTVLHP